MWKSQYVPFDGIPFINIGMFNIGVVFVEIHSDVVVMFPIYENSAGFIAGRFCSVYTVFISAVSH